MRDLFYLGIQDRMVLVTHALTQLMQCWLFGRKIKGQPDSTLGLNFLFILINKM